MTPEALSALYLTRAAALKTAVPRATASVLFTVQREASKRLAGHGEPGSYPIPIRTGHLRRSMGSRRDSDYSGYVFNRARYARAHHDGFRPYNNPHASPIPARPFLTDAVAAVDAGLVFRKHIAKALRIPT